MSWVRLLGKGRGRWGRKCSEGLLRLSRAAGLGAVPLLGLNGSRV